MIYLKFTHVDALTKKSIHDEPARTGPVFPDVAGLTFGFALESQYPTDKPVMFGTANDGANWHIDGVLEQVTPSEYDTAMLEELEAREALAKAQSASQIASVRYRNETAGFTWQGFTIATDTESQSKIRAEREAAKDGRRKDTDVWKCQDQETGVTLYRPTSNEEMVKIGDAAYFRTQACYAREAELMGAVADGTYVASMLNEGWPD